MVKKNGKLLSAQILLLTFAHLFNDFYAGFLIPLLSYFQTNLNLTITQVSILPTIMAVFGSMLQPVFGFLGDRSSRKWFMILGVLSSAIFMSSLCYAPNFIFLVLILAIGSAGIASFHPNGAASVANLSSYKSTFLMSIFIMAGSVGLAGGPVVISAIATTYGIDKLWVASIPGIILTIVMIKALPSMSQVDKKVRIADLKIIFAKDSWPLWIMFSIMFLRSVVITSFICFMSILFAEKGSSMQESGISISIFLFSGTIGGLIGGYFADIVNRKIIIAISSFLAFPLLLWFLHESDTLSIILLSLSGMVILSAAAVNISIVQELYPGMESSISGIAMGMVWGMAGLMLPIIGNLADKYSMRTALEIVSYLLIVAGLLVFILPKKISSSSYSKA